MLPYFHELKKMGFPHDPATEDDKRQRHWYQFTVEAWLPPEFSPENDPATDDPLPVPKRPVTLAEKYAALAAVHDAHGPGSEKTAPWAVTARQDEPVRWLPKDAGRGAHKAASWYYLLVETAKDLDVDDVDDLTTVCGWVKDVTADLKKPTGKLVDDHPGVAEAGLLSAGEGKATVDDASFRPAAQFRQDYPERFPTHKALVAFLKDKPRPTSGGPKTSSSAVHRSSVSARPTLPAGWTGHGASGARGGDCSGTFAPTTTAVTD